MFRCKCDCGNETVVDIYSLRSGAAQSCGCYNVTSHVKHGWYKHPLYRKWVSMRQRCYDKNCINFNDYGGRGISMCDRWKDSFENFRDDIYQSYLDHVEKHGERTLP